MHSGEPIPVSGLADVPRRRPGVLAQEAQGQTVLLRPEDGSYYAVADVGARIWALCDGARSVSEIAAEVCAEFDAPLATIQADVLEFVGELRSEQLLVAAA
jgi:pyrroloquinoline quinone biosynthesis protein D